MTSTRLAFFALAVLSYFPSTAPGQERIFSIDLAGLAQETGHRVRAYGTITLDLTRSTLAAVRSSRIFIQHEGDAPLLLQPLPLQLVVDPSDGLQWAVADQRLYINRISTENRIIQWNTAASVPQFTSLFFESGPPNNPHGMFYRYGGHDDTVILKAGGFPDGPRGFLVGVEIPEPSSAALLISTSLVAACHARRLRTCTRCNKRLVTR
jgi:hypothetical protein